MSLLKTLFKLPQVLPSGTSSTAPIAFDELDMRALPPLRSSTLLELVGFDERLTQLYRIVGISENHFDVLYRQPVHALAEAVQLAPASENNHHCGPGGLLKHTLEVTATALHIRKSYQLPLGGNPEDMAREEHHWTYGVFVACLLHDIGKILTRFQIVLNMADGTQKLWNPHNEPIYETGAVSYGIVFQECEYKAHQRMGVTLYSHIIPQIARAWLAQHSVVMSQTLASIWGDTYESQVIGDIVTQADRASTGANTDITNADLRFPGARESLADRLIQKLRQLLSDGAIKLNKDGGMGWVANEDVYLVCRPLAELLVKSFEDIGATGIPSDPVRIYDVLQEHGFALPTSDGKAVWRINVQDNQGKFSHTLTCLKFKTRRLFLPVRLPQSFDGVIRVFAPDDDAAPAPVTAPERQAMREAALEKPAPREPAPAPDIDTASAETDQDMQEADTAAPDEHGTVAHDIDETDPTGPETGRVAEAEDGPENDAPTLTPPPPETSPAELKEVPMKQRKQDPMASESIRITDWHEDVALEFWEWVCDGVLSRRLAANNTTASVHFVGEGVFLVTPRIFKHYCKHAKLGEDSYTKLQKRFQRLGYHRRTALTRLNVHPYLVDTGNGKSPSKLNGWLIPYERIFPDGAELPQPNKLLKPADATTTSAADAQ